MVISQQHWQQLPTSAMLVIRIRCSMSILRAYRRPTSGTAGAPSFPVSTPRPFPTFPPSFAAAAAPFAVPSTAAPAITPVASPAAAAGSLGAGGCPGSGAAAAGAGDKYSTTIPGLPAEAADGAPPDSSEPPFFFESGSVAPAAEVP